MNTVDEIKLAALKHKITAGIESFVHGRFETYSNANIMQLADEVGRVGRIRLNGLRLKVAVMRKGNEVAFKNVA
jgi:hypothetical protein